MSNMENWNKVSKPPLSALKQIGGGRLRGMTDISPQWRYQAMTEVYGPCGIGWKYTVDRKWAEAGNDGQVMCFADVSLYTKVGGEWSDAIPGSGGAMLVELEKNGLHASDEGYKMAVTDALSVAMKMIGMGAEIYLGNFDGTKYKTGNPPAGNSGSSGQTGKEGGKTGAQAATSAGGDVSPDCISEAQRKMIFAKMKSAGMDPATLKGKFGVESSAMLKKSQMNDVLAWIDAGGDAEPTICKGCAGILENGKCWNINCDDFAG